MDTAWSLASFYIGEERVTADLAPFLLAAPSGEVELFLATQLVDEARHTALFDRFGAEVMALDAARTSAAGCRSSSRACSRPGTTCSTASCATSANQIKAHPDDLDLFVEGIVTYHMVIEGVLAMTGQQLIIKYMEEHDLYPGFRQGFSLVERDEHRHIAFGVRFLKDAMEQEPRYRERIESGSPSSCRRRRTCSCRPTPRAPASSSPTATARGRSTATPTAASSGAWA